jgi:hypothetical protein
MHGLSERVRRLFGDADVLAFVDDWRGGDHASERAPVFYMGRTLFRRDFEHVDDLLGLLDEHYASSWHVRKGRQRSLFAPEHYWPIVRVLDRIQSRQYSLNREVGEFGAIEEEWRAIRTGPVGGAWATDAPHAKALFLYINLLSRHLDAELARGLRFRIVVNRLDWPDETGVHSGLRPLGGSVDGRGESLAVADPNTSEAEPFLPMLGLVDSEAWAFGRLQSRELPNGQTVRQRLLDWKYDGRPNKVLFTQSELDGVLQQAPNELSDWWLRFVQWTAEGRGIELSGRSRHD